MDEIGAMELWRGAAHPWECDQTGRMSGRFYVAKAMEGLATLARHLGEAHAFTARATATLAVREHHIRFVRPVRAGQRLSLSGVVSAFEESSATIVQSMRCESDGALCASFVVRIEHVDPADQRAFPWPSRSRDAAARLKAAPAEAAEAGRSLQAPDLAAATAVRADASGLERQGLGVVRADSLDVFGRMACEGVIARLEESEVALIQPMHDPLGERVRGRRIGLAALERRIVYAAMPRGGEHLEVRARVDGSDPRSQHLEQWLLDPVSGRAWAVAQSILAAVDLDADDLAPLSADPASAVQDIAGRTS